ncbi:MAG: FAD-binding protein [Methylococcaceae bacterium]|nr:FAD-binding protein [Methylococcaceae bacterium]
MVGCADIQSRSIGKFLLIQNPGVDTDLKQLRRSIEGDVLTDRLARMLYATDASPYQQLPLAVVRPRHARDCAAILQFASRSRLPIIPRTAGTSLAGQCVGRGLVVDFSRYMNRIVEIDAQRRTAIVEPGVICDQLNQAVLEHRLLFGPNPSTSKYCAIGGMVGNNAWGIQSQRYGSTREHILELEALLSDGSPVVFGPLASPEVQTKLALRNLEGTIYRTLVGMIDENRALIQKSIPAPDGIHRNTGYALDVLCACQPWESHGSPFNLAPFLCGTEGTLVLVTAVKVRLVPVPPDRSLLCAHFESLDDALRSVSKILVYRPAALEIIDRHILERTEQNTAQQENRFWLQGKPDAVLLIELHTDNIERAESVDQAIREIREQIPAYSVAVVTGPRIEQVWALRKAGLGLLMGMKGPLKAVTGIEDTAVPVAELADYVRAIKTLLRRHETDCVVFGPAGRGVLHLRPELDLNSDSGRKKYRAILESVADIVMDFGGSLSAKHGDGRLRAAFLERVLGSEIVSLLVQVKHAFDPSGILNPDKILGTLAPDSDLRETLRQSGSDADLYFDWSRDGGFRAALQKCNGAGVCLQRQSTGNMCPSYMATREEQHGTRGRANILRQLLSSEQPNHHDDQTIKEVLDLCIQCKACKTECPAGVDMARMKAEYLQIYNDRYGVSLRSRMIDHFAHLSRFGSHFPDLSNAVLEASWMHRLLGFHCDRRLPRLAAMPFSSWWSRRPIVKADQSRGSAVLILDVFNDYYEPDIAKAAVVVLEALGYQVLVTACLSFGRVQLSQGLLGKARRKLIAALDRLEPYAQQGLPIIGLEPSEILTLRDEAPDLFKDSAVREKIGLAAKQTMLFEEFVLQNQNQVAARLLPGLPAGHVLIHEHCHQKSLLGMGATLRALQLIPGAEVELIPSGCCGMAGAFGYQREHFSVSQKIAELALFPAIRNAPKGARIVATGASCRHQISDGLGLRAYHVAELFAEALGLTNPDWCFYSTLSD